MTPSPEKGQNFFGGVLGSKPTREPIRIDFCPFWANLFLKKSPKIEDFHILNFQIHFLSSYWNQRALNFLVESQMIFNKMLYANWASQVCFGVIWLLEVDIDFFTKLCIAPKQKKITPNSFNHLMTQDKAFKPGKSKIFRQFFSGRPFFKIMTICQIRPNQVKPAKVAYCNLLRIVSEHTKQNFRSLGQIGANIWGLESSKFEKHQIQGFLKMSPRIPPKKINSDGFPSHFGPK